MKKKILNNITKFNKSLLIYRIIATCYKDKNRIEEIEFLENKIIELCVDQKKYEESYQYGDYRWLYNKIENDAYTFYEVFQNVEDYINNRCRMVSIMTLNNLPDSILKGFGDRVINYLNRFTDIDEASEFTYQHTSIELNSFIDLLITYMDLDQNKSLNKISALDYIKKNRNELSNSINNWVDVFNQIKIIMKNFSNHNDAMFNVINEKYLDLLVYYFIIVTSQKFNF